MPDPKTERRRYLRALRMERLSRRAKRWDRARYWRAVSVRAKRAYLRAKGAVPVLWGGSRWVTDEAIEIVGDRAYVTSRKRVRTYGNPRSDHHVSQVRADAVDFAIQNAHWLKNEISRRLGGPRVLEDYGTFVIERKGRRFRVQIIAGTHGTGPHLHVGARRI